MRKIVLITLLSLSGLWINAQEINVTFKKGVELKDSYKRSKVLAMADDGNGGVIIARMYGSWMGSDFGYYAEHYNDKFLKVKSYTAEGDNDAFSVGAVISEGTINYIEYAYDKKQKSLVIFANQGNVKDMKFTRKAIITIPQERNKNASVKFMSHPSKNAGLISVDINTGAGVEKGEKHKVYVINNKLDILIESDLDKDFYKGAFEVKAIDMSPDNKSVYLVGKALIRKPAKNTPDYFYDITKVSNGDSKTVQTFKAGNSHVSQVKVVATKDRVICVGIYSDGEDEWQKGFCYFALDPARLDVTASKQLPFTDDMLKLYNVKKMADKIRKFDGRDLFITDNNDFIYNAEQYDWDTHISGKESVTYYTYGDIVSVKINKDGDLDRITTIKKTQRGNGTAESTFSYVPLLKDNKMCFFLNGTIETKEGFFIDHTPGFGIKGVDFNFIRIDENGTIEYKKIFDGAKEKSWTLTTFGGIMPGKKACYFICSNNDTTEKRAIKVEL